MARKRYKPEEIVAKLRQVDVLVSQGQNRVDAIRQIGVSEVTYYRWRQEFGGLKIEQVKRLKDLELENSRLRKAVSDLTECTEALLYGISADVLVELINIGLRSWDRSWGRAIIDVMVRRTETGCEPRGIFHERRRKIMALIPL